MRMKKLITLLVILTALEVFATSPGMIIRCRRPSAAAIVKGVISCPDGFFAISDVCLPLAVEGSCPDGFVLRVIDLGDGITEEVCVPDCSEVAACAEFSCSSEDVAWDISREGCGCFDDFEGEVAAEPSFNFCGCPEPLSTAIIPGVGDPNTIVSDVGLCVLETEDCFDADIEFSLGPIICDEALTPSTTISIVVTGPSGAALTDPVRVSDLENCVFIEEDNNALLALSDLYLADMALEPDPVTGFVTIDINIEDLSEAAQISLGFDDNLTVIDIPACPTLDALDPCSCSNPDNVLSDDGMSVLYWEDKLTIIGTAGDQVILTDNSSNPGGFLMPTPTSTSATPFAPGFLGTIPPGNVLELTFYKDATSSTTDIAFTVGAISDTFNETCGLAPTACFSDPIPTLGQWALIILGVILLVVGLVSYKVNSTELSKIRIRK